MRTLLISAALAAISLPAQAADDPAKGQSGGDQTSAQQNARDRTAYERWEKRPKPDEFQRDQRVTPTAPAAPPFQPYTPPQMTTIPQPYTNPYGSTVTAPYSPSIPTGPSLP